MLLLFLIMSPSVSDEGTWGLDSPPSVAHLQDTRIWDETTRLQQQHDEVRLRFRVFRKPHMDFIKRPRLPGILQRALV